MGKMIGYARLSIEEQNFDLQIDALKAAGCKYEDIYTDKVSGTKTTRKAMDKCLSVLDNGDTLIIWKLDRLGKSMSHLVSVVEDLKNRGVGFKSTQDGDIDTTTANGELVFNIFASFAQFERRLIQERTNAGLKAARARGMVGGRKKVLKNDPKVIAAKKMHEDKTMSIQDICIRLDISKATLYRYLKI